MAVALHTYNVETKHSMFYYSPDLVSPYRALNSYLFPIETRYSSSLMHHLFIMTLQTALHVFSYDAWNLTRKIQRLPKRKIIVFSSNSGPFSQFWTCLPDPSINQNIAVSSHGKKLTRIIPGVSTFLIPWEKRTWCISPICRCIYSVCSSRVETCSSCRWNWISIASVVGGSAASSGCFCKK